MKLLPRRNLLLNERERKLSVDLCKQFLQFSQIVGYFHTPAGPITARLNDHGKLKPSHLRRQVIGVLGKHRFGMWNANFFCQFDRLRLVTKDAIGGIVHKRQLGYGFKIGPMAEDDVQRILLHRQQHFMRILSEVFEQGSHKRFGAFARRGVNEARLAVARKESEIGRGGLTAGDRHTFFTQRTGGSQRAANHTIR